MRIARRILSVALVCAFVVAVVTPVSAKGPDPLHSVIAFLNQLFSTIHDLKRRLSAVEARVGNLPSGGGGLRVIDSGEQQVGLLASPTDVYVTIDGQTFLVPASPAGFSGHGAELRYFGQECSGPAYAFFPGTTAFPLARTFVPQVQGVAESIGYYVDFDAAPVTPPPPVFPPPGPPGPPVPTPQNYSRQSTVGGVLGPCEIPTLPNVFPGEHWALWSTIDLSGYVPPFHLQGL